MNVLVIPEDFRKDQYILKPILSALFEELNIQHVKVLVCRDPLLGGVSEALKWDRVEEILKGYAWQVDLFILCVDRDGQSGRRIRLDQLEDKATGILKSDQKFIGENAWQEIEVWLLAGITRPSEWVWREVRSEENPKERYFETIARLRGVLDSPGQGRKILAEEAADHYRRIRQLCREDILNLETRIRTWIGENR